MSRPFASMRMSTRSELVSGVTILSASLLMRAVSGASGAGLFRDLLGVLSVLFLFAGIGVLAVGFAHRVLRAEVPVAHPADPLSRETLLATGAVIGVGIGCTVGAAYTGALPVAVGTAIGAAAGIALASRWGHQHRTH